VPADRWMAMTRLDENRAKAQVAQKAGVPVTAVQSLVVWGNHSPTMYPDFENARINGKAALDVIPDRTWFETDFLKTIQQRGKAIIDARGKSSAASAANAVVNHLHSMVNPTPEGERFSAAILSDGNEFGIPEGLVYSFPMRTKADGTVEVLPVGSLSDFAREKLMISARELEEEREAVAALLK